MKINHITQLAQIGILAAAMLLPTANAAIVFNDTFDGSLTKLTDSRNNGTWSRSNARPARRSTTSVDVGNGVLRVETRDAPYGGAVTSLPNADFDFFTNEITISLTGINIESTGNGRLSSQGLKIGVASILSFSQNSWERYSSFGAGYDGNGYFSFAGINASVALLQAVPLQSIPSPYLNFDVTQISALKLTLNDTHYRLAFEFGNELNVLSLSGLHYLNKDQWNVTNPMRRLVFDKNNAAADLADAQALIPADPIAVADATAAYDTIVANYDAKWLIEESKAGWSHIFIGAISGDGEGAAVTIGDITVETTNMLGVLKTP